MDLPTSDVDVVVTGVADGESFRAQYPTCEIEVRLLGINSPELDECHGQAAKDALDRMISGREIGLATESENDQFGRVLARAVVNDRYVNLEMVGNGDSIATADGGTDRPVLLQAEERARAAEIGLWASEVCGAVGPRASLEIRGVDYDPPGPDDDESVTIVNTGTDPIDLAGFVLRDESSVNRFVFPAVTLEPGQRIQVTTNCGGGGDGTISWCAAQPIWNNGGDTALVLDRVGRIAAFHRY